MERKGWGAGVKDKIKHYGYNHRKASSPYEMGISSVGSLHACGTEHHIDCRLSTPDANLLTTGVIAFYYDADTKEFVMLLSSLRMAMYALEEMLDGYAMGSLQIDWTYGLSKEKIPTMTMGICDVKQHGRIVAFGPTRFETTNTVRIATKGLKAFLERLARCLCSDADEPLWHPTVLAEFRAKYAYLVPDLIKHGEGNSDADMPPPADKSDDESDGVSDGELVLHSGTLPPPPLPPPVDEVAETLEGILAPAMEKTGDSPRVARHNSTRTRAPSAREARSPPPSLVEL